MRGWFRSLQLRLAVRVMALYVVATAVVIGILMFRAYDTARSLTDQELVARASDLAKYILVGPNGAPRLDLPPRLAAMYDDPSTTDIFAIRDAGGRIVAAAPPRFGELVTSWPPATQQPAHFDVRDLGTERDSYGGISIRLQSSAGPLSISVARSGAATALVYSLLRKFIHDIIWAVSFLVLAALAIGVLAIRSGLKSVRDVSEKAAAIGPHATSVRLPEENLPSEITPLVTAVNRAFDRLDQGFAVQRQFTANAAHELRTPLAIITASLDAMEGNGELEKLKTDVARMNRLVEQLLRVARLDAIALDVSQPVELNEVACEVVETMAPWALARKRTLAFSGAEQPVRVKGNAHAIADAIRNLVENAIAHSPAGAEVLVSSHPNGSVSVADHGPGISAADEQRIFDRFWRGKNSQTEGAGLGLAIVQEIMKMHGGTIAVENGPQGGAVFTLCFTSDIAALTSSP
jgi:two-component system, OmpR family, sensor histidine kinase TctE